MEKLTDNSEKSLSSQKTFVKKTRHNPDKAYIRVHLKELYQLRIDKSNIRRRYSFQFVPTGRNKSFE